MDLLEYQGKQLFARHGLKVSPGRAVTAVDDAVAASGVGLRQRGRCGGKPEGSHARSQRGGKDSGHGHF